tara:strand:+ start:260 stop:559 length:300 start_codon:yes stop_codon:yes gene_type:complete
MESNYDKLLEENRQLKENISIIQEEIKKLNMKNDWSSFIDEKVDTWYDKFNDDVDIGRVSVFEILGKKLEIDVLPDHVEKAIYKKCIKIIISILSEVGP